MKYIVKNKGNKEISRCSIIWQPQEMKAVELSESDLFQVKTCVNLVIIAKETHIETKEEIKEETTEQQEETPEEGYICPNCGKKYKMKNFYTLHLKKCKGGIK